jgi:hypothetical protein
MMHNTLAIEENESHFRFDAPWHAFLFYHCEDRDFHCDDNCLVLTMNIDPCFITRICFYIFRPKKKPCTRSYFSVSMSAVME